VNAETIPLERLPAEPTGLTLDLSSIELEPVPGPMGPAADALDVLPLPESLSLDELLGVGPEPPAPTPATQTSAPVFEPAETDAAPLRMVEAGKGEPPALSVEDLLAPGVDAPTPADTLTIEFPELDLTALSEVPSPAPVEDVFAGSTVADAVVEPSKVPAEESSEDQGLAPVMAESAAPVPSAAGLAAALAPDVTEPPSSDRTPEMRPPHVDETGVIEPHVGMASAAAASELPAPEVVAPHELAAMRDAVTARVAEEIRHELSEKLLDRFEKIVWEVVPDLAEILITKEIERIRRLAEEERQS
jgi:hypothetical protein